MTNNGGWGGRSLVGRLASSPIGTTDDGDASGASDGSPAADGGDRTGGGGETAGADVQPAGGTSTEPRPIPLDTAFELLSNHRRRITLEQLRAEGPSTLSDLAEVVAARENDKPREAVTAQERKRTYVGLYQCHLPKLEEAGVVETDRSREVVPGPNAEQLLAVLDDAQEPSSAPADPRPYLVASVIGLLGTGIWTLASGPLAALGSAVTIVALGGVALLAARHVAHADETGTGSAR